MSVELSSARAAPVTLPRERMLGHLAKHVLDLRRHGHLRALRPLGKRFTTPSSTRSGSLRDTASRLPSDASHNTSTPGSSAALARVAPRKTSVSCEPRTPVRFLSCAELDQHARRVGSRRRVLESLSIAAFSCAERGRRLVAMCGAQCLDGVPLPERSEGRRGGGTNGRVRIFERRNERRKRGAAMCSSERERRAHAEAEVGRPLRDRG